MSLEATVSYIQTIQELKEKYRNAITIYLGIEEDMTCRIPSKAPYDFVIGSVHFLPNKGTPVPIDWDEEKFQRLLKEGYHNDIFALTEDYYRNVARMKDYAEVDIIGHLDLVSKFNEQESYFSFDDPRYLNQVSECIHSLGSSKIYEVNTGAIARGYRTSPYPHQIILTMLKELGASIMINSDCHNRAYLDCAFTETIQLCKDIGFHEVMVLKNGEFLPVDINEIH